MGKEHFAERDWKQSRRGCGRNKSRSREGAQGRPIWTFSGDSSFFKLRSGNRPCPKTIFKYYTECLSYSDFCVRKLNHTDCLLRYAIHLICVLPQCCIVILSNDTDCVSLWWAVFSILWEWLARTDCVVNSNGTIVLFLEARSGRTICILPLELDAGDLTFTSKENRDLTVSPFPW
jgi:hypothetical protein